MAEHPITPPSERFKKWEDDILNERDNVDHVLDCAWKSGFHAGADQELEACCEWVEKTIPSWAPHTLNEQLRAARRPKPLSLKEQALAKTDAILNDRNRALRIASVIARRSARNSGAKPPRTGGITQ